jgi:hypothetical protein
MDVTRNLVMTLVWWQKTGKAGFGKPIVLDPIEIYGRWVEKQGKIISQGEEVVTSAEVLVDRDMAIGDWLWKGSLSALSSSEETIPFSFAKEVVSFDKTPDIKGINYVRKVLVK